MCVNQFQPSSCSSPSLPNYSRGLLLSVTLQYSCIVLVNSWMWNSSRCLLKWKNPRFVLSISVMVKNLRLHSRFQVRVRACTSCKSLGQPGFYSLTWTHKIRFSGGGFPQIQKKKINLGLQFLSSFSDIGFSGSC